MIVYVPVYDGKRIVRELNTDEFKNITDKSIAMFKPGMGFYGSVYNDRVFLTEEDGWKYWAGGYAKSYTLEEVKSL